MCLVDFHCHLDLYSDFHAAVAEADAAKIYTLGVTTTPRAWPRNRSVTGRTNCVRAALGLHPQLVGDHANEVTLCGTRSGLRNLLQSFARPTLLGPYRAELP